MSKQRLQPIDWPKQLLEFVHSTSLAADFRSTLKALLAGAGEMIPCDGAAILWLRGDDLEVLASSGPPAPLRGLTLPAGQMGAARAVLDTSRGVMIGDTAEDNRYRPVPGEERVGSWLGVPLLVEGRAIGLLEWTDRRTGHFVAEDLDRAGELAWHAAPIFHRAKLLDDTRRRLSEWVEPRLPTSPQQVDLGAQLQQVVREAAELGGARHAFAFLLAESGGCLECVSALGDQQERLRGLTLRGDGSLAAWETPARALGFALGSDRPGKGAKSFDRLVPGPSDREKLAGLGIENPLILPLRVSGEPVGILGVAGPQRGRTFGQDALRLMTHLSGQASLIVERGLRGRRETPKYDYEMVLHSSQLGIGVLTVKGAIRVCNQALATLLADSERSLAGRSLADFLIPEDGRRLDEALDEVAITGQPRQVDTRLQLDSGGDRHMRVSLAFADVGGDAGGNLLAIVEDVSPLKILEDERVRHLRELKNQHTQLQELDGLRSRFVSNVSHELRTPLAVIKLYATLARKGRPEKQAHYLQTIEQEIQRLETIVENVLDLSRLDRQTLSSSPELLSAEEAVAQVLGVYEERARSQSVNLENRVRDAEIPRLWADRNHFVQMLTNLLDNALKYSPPGGLVWVTAGEVDTGSQRMLEIAVGDQGAGIPEEEQERVFERFYRGSNNTPSSTGTGLGLAIVRELMEQHGGRVGLESKVGEGSVFALQFPLAPPEEKG